MSIDVAMHDRRDGVEEGERSPRRSALRIASASAGEVSGPVATMTLSQSAGGRPAISSRAMSISGSRFERRGDGGGKAVAVDRERAAGRHLVGVGRAHDQRAEPAHLLVQEPDGALRSRIVGAERVGADQFGKLSGLVRGGRADRPHLVQHHGHAAARDLPGGLGAGEAAADDMNGSRDGHESGSYARAAQPATSDLTVKIYLRERHSTGGIMSADSHEAAERRNLIVADIVERTGIDMAMIERLVRAFYGRARHDPLIGPVFERHVADWEAHIPRHVRFLVIGSADERPLPRPADGGASAAADRRCRISTAGWNCSAKPRGKSVRP